jgi:hypothetical protein
MANSCFVLLQNSLRVLSSVHYLVILLDEVERIK